MNVLIAILGLAFLVFIHELGHFAVALAVGMRPRRFYIGFPPAVAKVERRGIEYGIGAIPLGGFVKIPGMHRPAPSDLDLYLGAALNEDPGLVGVVEQTKRELGRDEPSVLEPLRDAVARAELSLQARKRAEKGLREISDGLSGDAYWRAATWKRVVAILAGPAANVVLAILLFTILFMLGGGKVTTTVDQVLAGHPAAKAGLRAGDRIVAVNGQPVKATRISRRIQASGGRPLTLLVQRDGRELTIGPVRPRKDEGFYRLGFVLRGTGLSPPAAAWQSVKLVGVVTKGTAVALANVVHKKDRKNFQSTVGIVQASSNAISQGLQDYLFLLAFISLSLALLNLLPLLPLDGGHIAFSLVEGARGKPLARDVYERVSVVGIVLVLMLFFVGLTNDIGRLGGG
ncbi:MAG TPA: M50 family metallopeptidase [Gaiellaceae bacterium]